MTPQQIEAMKLALEALEFDSFYGTKKQEAITAIKEALAQPEQEPVTWGVDWGKAGDIPCVSIIKRVPNGGIEVMAVEYAPYSYTTPPQCKPLSSVELVKIELSLRKYHDYDRYDLSLHDFARAIEAAHGIKE